MTILSFPGFTRVEIFGGTVETATVTDARGTRPVLTDVGLFKYFVNVVEADGCEITMWDGVDYAEAIREANFLALDFGGKVIDRTGGAK